MDIQKYFEERMAKFEADLRKASSSGSSSLVDEFASFKVFILQSLKAFSQQLESVARQVDTIEMRSRRKILLLHGVEEQKDEDTSQVVTEVIKQHLKLDTFTTTQITRCHRMGRAVSSQKARPIVLKLASTEVRDSIWFSKIKLKGTGITLSEFLTRARHTAFMAARDRFGASRCWTRDGWVFILDGNGKRHRISSLSELEKIKTDPEKPAVKAAVTKTRRAAVISKK